MDQPFVSVVTPVFNGEKYLEECICSVLSQTYSNYEYIIVNNCSTDGSLKIAKKFAELDNRIQILNTPSFMTSLQNFNYSMRLISNDSTYCKVVHADDWIFPECIEKMVMLAYDNPNLGIISSYRLVNSKVESDGLPYNRSIYSGKEIAIMNLTDGPFTFGSPSALLIRSDLIRARDKFYNESHTGADTEVCLDILLNNDFGFIHQVLSFSRVHEHAITGKQKNLHTSYANNNYVFRKYASFYLSEEEIKRHFKLRIRNYYFFLGGQLLKFREKNFWNFHKTGLKNLDVEFNWVKY
jgi:glycosyltransferase involved in cell wall biosynthesis